MSKKLKVFTLSKKKWLRGNSDNYTKIGYSQLWAARTKAGCCLGLLGMQECGIPSSELTGVATPVEIDSPWRSMWPAGVLRPCKGGNSTLTDKVMGINDNQYTTDAEKIRLLRPIFRKWGYRIVVTE